MEGRCMNAKYMDGWAYGSCSLLCFAVVVAKNGHYTQTSDGAGGSELLLHAIGMVLGQPERENVSRLSESCCKDIGFVTTQIIAVVIDQIVSPISCCTSLDLFLHCLFA